AAIGHYKLEMLYQTLNRTVNLVLIRQVHFAIRKYIYITVGYVFDKLVNNVYRLTNLFQTHQIPCITISAFCQRHFKIDRLGAHAIPVVGVAKIWLILAQVALNPGSTRQWSG